MPAPDDYIPQPGYPGPFPPDLGSFQPLNENLTEISDLTTDAFGRGLLPQTSAVNVRSYIGAGESGFDGAFSSLSGIPTTIAGYGITNAQPLDADLTTISGLTATTDNFLQSKAGAWASRTVAQVKTDLSLSGSNTGDQVSIVGITGTLAEFNTALTGADFATGGGTASGTNTGDVTLAGENYLTISAQVITAAAVNLSGTHVTGTLAAGRFPALTGDVTTIAGALASTIAANAVSLAKMSQVATGTILGRVTAATGNVEALTGTQATTLLDTFTSSLNGLTPLSGGGTANFLRADGTWQAPAGTAGITDLTGDVTATGPGSVAATIAASAVTLAKMADVATASVFYRNTAGTGAPEVNTLATLKTDLGLTGTNSGDQTITLTGDVTGSGTGSFATALASVASAGTTGGSTAIPVVTIDVKGRVTGITTAAVIAPAGTLTGATLAANVLASSLTSFGAGIALGTPASGIATNLTGTASGLTAGNVTTNANLTGDVTSVGNAATVVTNANLTGDVTSVGNATTLTNAPVIAKVLTGYVSGAGTVAATDSILQAIQKLNGNDATNANLTGDVTSVGNATTIGALKVTNAMLAGSIDLTTKVTGVLPLANGGTNASTAATARTALGLAIGTDVLAYQPTQIQFGGATSSFPMLLRSSTILKARLADDSAYAQIQAQTFGNKTASAASYVLDFTSTISMFPTFLVNGTSALYTRIALLKQESGSTVLTNGGTVGSISFNTVTDLVGFATANTISGGTYSTIDMVFRTQASGGSSAVERMRFTAEGQLGIGTSIGSGLSGMLHIVPSAAATVGIYMKGYASQSGHAIHYTSSASADLFRVTADGDTLVGSSTNSSYLQVFATPTDTGGSDGIYLTRAGSLTATSVIQLGALDGSNRSALDFYTFNGSYNRAIRLMPDGTVAIGTTATSAMLHVVPNAAATKGIFIKGAASQTGNYLEVVTSAAAAVCKLTTNSAATVFNLHLGQLGATQSLIFSSTTTDARIESDGYALYLRSRDGTQSVSIFTKSTTVAAFSVDANATMKYGQVITGISLAAWTTQGVVSRTAQNGNVTYTDSTSTGTVATACLNSMAGQIIAASSVTTYTNASVLFIESSPVAGANVTITNRWSIHTSGAVYFEGTLQLAGGASLLKTQAALTAGSTANVPTLSSGPVTGNPTKWIAINDAGTTRYIPTW